MCSLPCFFFFFFNHTATTEIYTLSLHDALPILPKFHLTLSPTISALETALGQGLPHSRWNFTPARRNRLKDRKSTRLNSSHGYISYAVFCLKKKKTTQSR